MKSSVFDTNDDILFPIKQFAEEKHVNLLLGKPSIKIQCWKNSVEAETKIEEKCIYKEVTYHCPHSVKMKPPQHKDLCLYPPSARNNNIPPLGFTTETPHFSVDWR